jgi:hypothetical protein
VEYSDVLKNGEGFTLTDGLVARRSMSTGQGGQLGMILVPLRFCFLFMRANRVMARDAPEPEV